MERKAKELTKRIGCLLLTLCVGSSSCFSLAASKETLEQIEKAEQEKLEAEEQKKETEQEKGQLHNKKSEMEAYLKNLNEQAGSLNEQIAILEQDKEAKELEIAEKEEEIQEAQEEVERQYQDMKRRIQYMYENGQNTILTYLATALRDGISSMLSQAEYAVKISEYDRDMLLSFQAFQNELEQRKSELEDEREAMELLQTQLEEKKTEVAKQQKATGSKISEFDALIAQKAGELSSAEELVALKTQLLNELMEKARQEEAAANLEQAKKEENSTGAGNIIAGDAQISGGTIQFSSYEQLLLASMIYCEAGNQGLEGQKAVGFVIMNRVRSKLFPNSLEAVLRQSKQFSPVSSGRFDLVLKAEQDPDIPNIVTQSCWDAAAAVVNGSSNVGDSLFFRTWKPVPSLITNLQNGGVPYWIIKDHIFYYYWTNYTTGEVSKPEETPTPPDAGEQKPETKPEDKVEEDKQPEEDKTGEENQPSVSVPEEGENSGEVFDNGQDEQEEISDETVSEQKIEDVENFVSE